MKTIVKALCILAVAGLLMSMGAAQRVHAKLEANPKAGQVYQGQLSATLPAGTTVAQAKAFAEANGLEFVRQLLVPDRFVFRIKEWQQSNMTQLTLAKVAGLANLPGVAMPTPDIYLSKHDSTPNDPLYSGQWALTQVNVNKAWDFQKGKDGIVVAVLDDSCLTTHEDLSSRVIQGYSAYYRDSDPIHIGPEPGWFESHGTMTSSTACAATNNGRGMAGVTWQNVKLLPLRFSDPASDLIPSLEYDALQWLINQGSAGKPKAHVLNMSFGTVFQKDAQEETLLNQLFTQGTVLCASSGNYREFGIPAGWPASDKNVISCGATGPGGNIASYSCAGTGTGIGTDHKVNFAAPGGDGFDPSTSMTVCDGITGGYLTAGINGTSFSAPMISGAIALLLSQGVPAKAVYDQLKFSANARGTQVPNNDYGWGEIDVFEALRRYGGSATFISPEDGATYEYQKLPIEVQLGNIDPATVTLFDGSTAITDFTITATDKVFSTLTDTHSFSVGQHTLTLHATSTINQQVLAPPPSITFRIQPHQQASGTIMFAVPYGIGNLTPPQLLPGSFTLQRFVYQYDQHNVALDAGNWYRYPDPLASFHPSDASVTKDGDTADQTPIGVGYFLTLGLTAPIVVTDGPDLNTAYRIQIRPGWAIFGNPFPFAVSWNLVEVNSVNQRMTMGDAVLNEYLMPQIYRWSPTDLDYTWMAAPQGYLYAWEAAWVKCLKPCWLVVHPIPASGRGRGENRPNVTGDGWALQLGAQAGGTGDNQNFIGATGKSSPAYDLVEKAPAFMSGVTLAIDGSNGKTKLAQYLKPTNSRSLEWTFRVTAPNGKGDVTLTWSEIVRPASRVNYTLVDLASGRRLSMNATSSYTFKPASSGTPRAFKVIAEPNEGAKLVVTGLQVSSSKGRGPAAFTVLYSLSKSANVTVTVLSPTGKRVKVLDMGTKAMGANSAAWMGRDERGVSQPPGVYLAEITAADTNGQQVRVVTPIVLTR